MLSLHKAIYWFLVPPSVFVAHVTYALLVSFIVDIRLAMVSPEGTLRAAIFRIAYPVPSLAGDIQMFFPEVVLAIVITTTLLITALSRLNKWLR